VAYCVDAWLYSARTTPRTGASRAILATVNRVPLCSDLEGYADAALPSVGFVREYSEETTHDRLQDHLTATLGKSELDRLLAEGAAFTPDAAIAPELSP
jgi:hypothetical protein